MQQTMREVLRAVAGLAGVELPGLPGGLQDDEAPPPRLDIKTLKDRFRNDLEGFSIKTTEELTKQAKERTRAALDAVQNELGGRIEQVAAELREQLQLPAQVEKLLEPSVKDAAARLERSFSQKVEKLFAEQELLARERFQGVLSSVQGQTINVGEAEARLEKSLSQKVEQLFAQQEQLAQERLQAALSSVQGQTLNVGEAEARLERSLSQKVEQLFAEQARLVQERLQGALSSVQAQTSSVGEAEARLESSLSQKVEKLFAKQDQLVQERLQGALSSVQAQTSSVGEAEARLEKSLSQKVEQLFAQQDQLAQERLQGTLASVQAQISTLGQTVQQIRELKADSIARLSAEWPNAAVDNATNKYESRLSDEVDGGFDQALSRIDLSFNDLLKTFKIQPVQSAVAGLGEQRKAIPFDNTDMQSRVEQALEYLDRLGSKSSHPASTVESHTATP